MKVGWQVEVLADGIMGTSVLLSLGEGVWPPIISSECSLECQEFSFALFPPLGFTTHTQITGKMLLFNSVL